MTQITKYQHFIERLRSSTDTSNKFLNLFETLPNPGTSVKIFATVLFFIAAIGYIEASNRTNYVPTEKEAAMSSPTISFKYNRHNRKVKTAPVTMAIRYAGNEKYMTIITGLTPNQWDEKRSVVKNHPQQFKLNMLMDKYRSKVNDYYLDQILNDKAFNLNGLINYLKGFDDTDFIQFVSNEVKNQKLSQSTIKQHDVLIGYLKSFNDPIYFSSMDFNFIPSFENFLLGQSNYRDKNTGLSKNYIATMLTILKKYTRLAVIQGRLKNDPFLGFQIKRQKVAKTNLDLAEIMLLQNIDLSNRRGKVEVARDAFVFSCYTGLRYSDLFGSDHGENYGLRVRHLIPTPNGLRLEKTTQKKKIPIDIPLYYIFGGMPETIVKRYIEGKKANDYVFGKLTNGAFNDTVRSLIQQTGIEKEITGHSGRHTCGTLLEEAGVHSSVIGKILGHTDPKSTKIYAKTNSNVVDFALREAFK